MNWLMTIKRFLGRFWGDFFHSGDFLPGVEFLLSKYSQLTENSLLNWRNGMIAANTDVLPDEAPYPIWIDTNDIHREWYGFEKLFDATISGGTMTYTCTANEFLNGTYDSQADEDSMGWIATAKYPIKEPYMMVTHLYGETTNLVRGLDYDIQDGVFLFYVDPFTLDIPTAAITDKDGQLHILYKLYGFAEKTSKVCDPVTGFESQWLNPYSDIAWDIHTNGATFYNVKRLLGKASDSVVCENDDRVTRIWQEQGWNCMMVGTKVYSSLQPANYTIGTAVHKGDVLFGHLKMYKGSDTPTVEEVPGIKVMTDVGELTAENMQKYIYVDAESGAEVLPLTGKASTIDAYRALCVANIADSNCPAIEIPYDDNLQVNPYQFVSKTLRRGRSVVARLVTDNVQLTDAAIRCIRKSCCASGMVNVFIASENDESSAIVETDSFLAAAGMMAVAVVGTLKIQEEYAEAKLI